tara:strand:- start:128 stop:514 length:387 start_codon:yes stop_codon:yes gene_type:complete
MNSNKNLSNLNINIFLNDIFDHLNEIKSLSNLLKESLLNSEHIIYKINKSTKLLYKFDGILSYVGKEKLLTKKQTKAIRSIMLIESHLELSKNTLENLEKLFSAYKNIIETSVELLNQKINLEKIIDH